MNPKDLYHHHLITGEVVFEHPDQPEVVNAIRLNGILLDKNRELPVRLLGKAQQILQLNFHQRMQDEKIKVLDVTLMNFTYLGQFTQQDFHAAPEGTKVQEVPQPANEAESPVQAELPLEEAVAQAEAKPHLSVVKD